MTNKLETFIEAHLNEFDTVELETELWLAIDARLEEKSLSSAKNKLRSGLIYFGLSATVIAIIFIYFATKNKERSFSTTTTHKVEKMIFKDAHAETITTQIDQADKQAEKEHTDQHVMLLSTIKKQETITPDTLVIVNACTPKKDNSVTGVKTFTGAAICKKNTAVIDSGIFYHISYVGGVPDILQHTLFWYTEKEIPDTYFIIEHFCWNRWVKRAKIKAKGIPGTGNYAGKIEGKFQHRFKIPPHSGENKMRVVLMSDSDVRIAVSKELQWVASRIEKVDHSFKKQSKEIHFSNETYYEIYDKKENLVKEGRSKVVSCIELIAGDYTLYYDNFITTINLK